MAAKIRAPTRLARSVSRDDDVNAQRFLSKFQIEKFRYMFDNFFDNANKDGMLQKDDISALLEKLRSYCGYAKDDERYLKMVDVMWAFYGCLMDQVRTEKRASAQAVGFATWDEALKPYEICVDNITMNQWLNMWGRLCRGAAGISGFPIWVQLLAHVFFDTIDRDGDGEIIFEEMKNYYRGVTGVPEDQLDKIAREGYRAMTANGNYKLNRENYLFCFANFLLGRGIYGPGKYIFGVFDNSDIDQTFKVKYNEDDE